MSSPNNAYKTHRDLSTTGATPATGILSVAVGMHKGGGVQLSGTFVGTVQFEETLDGGTTWIAKTVYPAGGGTGVTSATATGAWKWANGGSTNFRVRCSAFTSGPIVVDLTLTEGVDALAIPQAVTGPGGDTLPVEIWSDGAPTDFSEPAPVTPHPVTTSGITQVAVDTNPTLILAANASRRNCKVLCGGAATAFGPTSGVLTTTGFLLPVGVVLDLEGYVGALYAITGTSSTVSVFAPTD